MRFFIALSIFLVFHPATEAQYTADWDNYIMQVNQKPVSIVVDLGLKARIPVKDHPFVVIVRTKLVAPDANGQPGTSERGRLDEMENRLDSMLIAKSAAIYAGRFTQRGIREFYFYTIDSVGFLAAVHLAMAGFPDYTFLCQAREDRAWEHYSQVLYPPEKEYEGILSRRQIDELTARGDALRTRRRIEHHFVFPTRSGRDQFLQQVSAENFKTASMEDGPETEQVRFKLYIYRDDVPSYMYIDKVVLPLWEAARAQKGQYLGWETYVVR